MTPDRPDETLAPLLTKLREPVVFRSRYDSSLMNLAAETIEQERRLSAEKDATIAALTAAWADRASKLADTQHGLETHARITDRMLAEKDATIADLEQRIRRFSEEVRHVSVRMANSLMTPERLRELLKPTEAP
jgi:chromosome segregation ATPase